MHTVILRTKPCSHPLIPFDLPNMDVLMQPRRSFGVTLWRRHYAKKAMRNSTYLGLFDSVNNRLDQCLTAASNLICRFNPRSSGGGGEIKFYPLPYFLDRNDGRYRRKTFSTLSGIDLMSPTKISEKSTNKVLRNWCFSDVVFAI